MLSSPVAITQQQARLLLPLLQQIASSGTPGPLSCETTSGSCSQSGSSYGSSNSSPLFYPTPTRMAAPGSGHGGYSTDESESACRYSSDELFHSKKKNNKSSSAHSYCHVSMK